MANIIIVGSASMDLVVQTNIIPNAGETVLGYDFFSTPGGKGANQAVAAAHLHDSVYMIGAVGDDVYGKEILENLKQHHVDTSLIDIIENEASGTAHITLFENDNRIIVVPSANQYVTPERAISKLKQFKAGDIVLLQQEIPEATVEAVIRYAHDNGLRVVLNPAPFRPIDRTLIDMVDYLTPNETESEQLFEHNVSDALVQYEKRLIITQGAKGALYYDEEQILVPSIKANVVDTTGAGDVFNGALAAGLIENKDLGDAILFANKAASFAVTGIGAQGAIPNRSDLE